MGEAREVVEEALDGCLSKNISDWGKIKSTIKDALGDYVWKKTKRRPMILRSSWSINTMDKVTECLDALIEEMRESRHIRITCGWKRNLKKTRT